MKRCTLKIESVEPITLTQQEITQVLSLLNVPPTTYSEKPPLDLRVTLSNGNKLLVLENVGSVLKNCNWPTEKKRYFVFNITKSGLSWNYNALLGNNLDAHHEYRVDGSLLFTTHLPDIASTGTELVWEYAFQRVPLWQHHNAGESTMRFYQECLSIGHFAVPCRYPSDPEEQKKWKEAWPYWAHKLLKIGPDQWDFFISAIEGHFLEDIFTEAERVSDQFTPSRAFRRRLQELQATSRIINTGCFHGYEGNCVSFTVGNRVRLLWTLTGEQRQIFVVDSPAVSACYIFTNQAHAEDWATGRVRSAEAQEHALRIVHKGSWEERITKALEAMGVPTPTP